MIGFYEIKKQIINTLLHSHIKIVICKIDIFVSLEFMVVESMFPVPYKSIDTVGIPFDQTCQIITLTL